MKGSEEHAGGFVGKVAIVTGAGSGMGRATTLLLARRGARVVVADIDQQRADWVAEEVRGAGGRALAISVDVASEADVRNMVESAVDVFGGVDILHNNAGDTGAAFVRDNAISIDAMTVELWQHHMNVNLQGAMLGCKWAIPEMLRRGGGVIINTSSNASLGGQETASAYGVSKTGLNGLTQYVATAYGRRGIRCNAVLPGLVMSPAAQGVAREILEPHLDNTLTPYAGDPEDVAYLVAFLASDQARYITGQLIAIDGGTSAHAPWYSDVRRNRAQERVNG